MSFPKVMLEYYLAHGMSRSFFHVEDNRLILEAFWLEEDLLARVMAEEAVILEALTPTGQGLCRDGTEHLWSTTFGDWACGRCGLVATWTSQVHRPVTSAPVANDKIVFGQAVPTKRRKVA